MTPLAATATGHAGTVLLVPAILILITLGYLLMCWLYPFKDCGRCKGTGKRRALFGSSFALCRRCHGDRRQLRTGRYFLNYLRELHDKADHGGDDR